MPWLGIGVSEAYKGKGMGGKLMEYIIGYARERGMGGILLTTHMANIRAQALYRRFGYAYLGTHTNGDQLYLLTFEL